MFVPCFPLFWDGAVSPPPSSAGPEFSRLDGVITLPQYYALYTGRLFLLESILKCYA